MNSQRQARDHWERHWLANIHRRCYAAIERRNIRGAGSVPDDVGAIEKLVRVEDAIPSTHHELRRHLISETDSRREMLVVRIVLATVTGTGKVDLAGIVLADCGADRIDCTVIESG